MERDGEMERCRARQYWLSMVDGAVVGSSRVDRGH
jgi:hypothetical protein